MDRLNVPDREEVEFGSLGDQPGGQRVLDRDGSGGFGFTDVFGFHFVGADIVRGSREEIVGVGRDADVPFRAGGGGGARGDQDSSNNPEANQQHACFATPPTTPTKSPRNPRAPKLPRAHEHSRVGS